MMQSDAKASQAKLFPIKQLQSINMSIHYAIQSLANLSVVSSIGIDVPIISPHRQTFHRALINLDKLASQHRPYSPHSRVLPIANCFAGSANHKYLALGQGIPH